MTTTIKVLNTAITHHRFTFFLSLFFFSCLVMRTLKDLPLRECQVYSTVSSGSSPNFPLTLGLAIVAELTRRLGDMAAGPRSQPHRAQWTRAAWMLRDNSSNQDSPSLTLPTLILKPTPCPALRRDSRPSP